MKQLKKLASLLLAMVMVFGLAATALASANEPGDPGTDPVITGTPEPTSAPTTGTITINNAVAGHTYSIYRILDLTFSPATTASPVDPANPDATPAVPAVPAAYAYTANEAWKPWLDTQTNYITFDAQGYASWVTGADAAEFAKLALEYAKGTGEQSNIEPVATITAPEEENPSVVFNGLPLGYYLVDSTVGTLCSLDTNAPYVTMEEKNEVPSNDKQVQENSDHSWGKVNDAEIGETVNFRSTVTLPEGSERVVYHDTMIQGLDFDPSSVKVYTYISVPSETPGEAPTIYKYLLSTSDYQLIEYTYEEGSTNGHTHLRPDPNNPESNINVNCTFTVAFESNYLDMPVADDWDATIPPAGTEVPDWPADSNLTIRPKTVYIEYSATINEEAEIGDVGNPNSSHLSYGNNGDYETTPGSSTTTYVWSFNIFKYTGDNHPLAGAEFVLLNSEKTEVARFTKSVGENGENVYRLDSTNQWTGIPTDNTYTAEYILESPQNGNITVEGLDAGTYYLREVKAPDGYNILAADFEVSINPTFNSETNPTEMSWTHAPFEVENKSGIEMPGTGGIGTTIFYVVGSVLLVGAAILLITKKRMSVSK